MSLLLSLIHSVVTIVLLVVLIRRTLAERKLRNELLDLKTAYNTQRFQVARLYDDLNHALGIR